METSNLKVENLAHALEFIRRSAYLHFVGGAFDPEHMWNISALAAHALCGEEIEEPTPWEEITKSAEEMANRLRELVDDGSTGIREPEAGSQHSHLGETSLS